MKMDKKSSIAVSTYKGYVDRNGVSRDDVKSFFQLILKMRILNLHYLVIQMRRMYGKNCDMN